MVGVVVRVLDMKKCEKRLVGCLNLKLGKRFLKSVKKKVFAYPSTNMMFGVTSLCSNYTTCKYYCKLNYINLIIFFSIIQAGIWTSLAPHLSKGSSWPYATMNLVFFKVESTARLASHYI